MEVGGTTSSAGTLITAYFLRPPEAQPGRGLHVRNSVDGGGTWSTSTLVAPGNAFEPDLAEAPGAIWLVYWRAVMEYSNIYYVTSTDGGTSWSAEYAVTTSTVSDTQNRRPTVAVTNSGRVIVAWELRGPDGQFIKYSYTDDDGATWQGPLTLIAPTQIEDVREPDLAVHPSGDVVAVVHGFNPS